MKKLAIVNHNLGSGGAEKLIYDIALELKKRDVNFSVILLTSHNCIYGKKLLEKGVDVIYLSHRWDIYSPKNIFRLIKVLKGYDVIHTHIYSAQLWTAFSSYFLPAKRYITTEHSTNNNRRGKNIFRYLDRWMYSRYDEIVSITDKTESALKEWIGEYKNRNIIQNGINVRYYFGSSPLEREKLGYKKEDVLLCQIARLNRVKKQETTLRALKELPDRYKVLFLGEGEERDSLEKLTKELGLDTRVNFLGYRSDIANILKMVDISLLTSEYEGLPISSLESMLLTPFIGSDVPGISDLVKDSGLLFDFDNHIDLKNKVLELGENKNFYEKIKDSCHEKAKLFSIENTVDRYMRVYEGIE
ncbi:MAG: glycosyltransferase [Cetobacterium sp.]|uniref:glycosyltransferase n=1 Tax=Cetobacterium sp. TaxID=2071632 RepID=UPI003F385F76